jgi:hypothetical protein
MDYYCVRREVRGVVVAMDAGGIDIDVGGRESLNVPLLRVRKYHAQHTFAERIALPAYAEPALTAHGCQGRTYKQEHRVFVSTFWERSQLYVALSRATEPALIRLAGRMDRITNQLPAALKAFQHRLAAAMAARTGQPWVGVR